jgi:hypothetical protein
VTRVLNSIDDAESDSSRDLSRAGAGDFMMARCSAASRACASLRPFGACGALDPACAPRRIRAYFGAGGAAIVSPGLARRANVFGCDPGVTPGIYAEISVPISLYL